MLFAILNLNMNQISVSLDEGNCNIIEMKMSHYIPTTAALGLTIYNEFRSRVESKLGTEIIGKFGFKNDQLVWL